MALTFAHYAAPALARPLAVGRRRRADRRQLLRRAARPPRSTRADRRAWCSRRSRSWSSRRWPAAPPTSDRLWPLDGRSRAACCRPPGCCSSRSPATRASRRWARRWSSRRAPSRARSRSRSASRCWSTRRSRSARWPGPARLRWRRPARRCGDRGRQRAAGFAACPRCARGAAVASLGVLLSLIVGVSRTVFAMASTGDLPGVLGGGPSAPPGPPPRRAGGRRPSSAAVVAALADVRAAIGFSSFAVLAYYAITNAAALTLDRSQRRWPRGLAGRRPARLRRAGASLSRRRSSVVGGARDLARALYLLSRTGTLAGR